MIPTPEGWTVELMPRGHALVHPGGRTKAMLFYRERARPLARLGALVRRLLAATPSFVAQWIGPPERLWTFDGEHAALVTVAGTHLGAPARRDFGFVFGDDFFSSLGSLCRDLALGDEITRLVRDLVRHDVHALGVRRRRYEYAPPPDWQPLARGLATEWLAPDYPRSRTSLLVYPANPTALLGTIGINRAVAALRDAGQLLEEPAAPERMASLSGLPAVRLQVRARAASGAPVLREWAHLVDSRYAYVLELSSADPARWPQHRAVLTEVVNTVQPVPAPSHGEATAGLLSHWLD